MNVEVGDQFLVEGVWDGTFEEHRFIESSNFFGSGLRVESDSVIVAPSRAIVDRIVIAHSGNRFHVSNSLPLLLHALEMRLDQDLSYNAETYTVLKGIRSYDPNIRLPDDSTYSLEQRYYFPVRIGPQGIGIVGSGSVEPFTSFEQYVETVQETLGRLVSNAQAPARAHPFRFRASLSRGYDSPATVALALPFARPAAYTAVRSNSMVPTWMDPRATNDDGSTIASVLGLETERLGHHQLPFDERFFFAGGTGDPELIFESLAADAGSDASPTVLLSGYHGGKVWALNPDTEYRTDELKRGDTSGLALTEVRLAAGWINVPVPFIGARAIDSLVRISQSPEMAPWRVGGDYDRPIPRRIVEEAGVPRGAFGERKRAVVQTVIAPRGTDMREDFDAWLREYAGRSLIKHRMAAGASLARWSLLRTAQKLGALAGLSLREPSRWAWLPGGDPTSLLFRWAVSRLASDAGPYPEEVRREVQAHLRGG
jgi:hypothetical protein